MIHPPPFTPPRPIEDVHGETDGSTAEAEPETGDVATGEPVEEGEAQGVAESDVSPADDETSIAQGDA